MLLFDGKRSCAAATPVARIDFDVGCFKLSAGVFVALECVFLFLFHVRETYREIGWVFWKFYS